MEAIIKLKIIWNVTTTEYLNTITPKPFNLKASMWILVVLWISIFVVDA